MSEEAAEYKAENGNAEKLKWEMPRDPFHPACKVHSFMKLLDRVMAWHKAGETTRADELLQAVARATEQEIKLVDTSAGPGFFFPGQKPFAIAGTMPMPTGGPS